jgi:hypothetical protein
MLQGTRKERAIPLKKIPIKLRHEPCFGLNTNSNRFGRFFNHSIVAFEMRQGAPQTPSAIDFRLKAVRGSSA